MSLVAPLMLLLGLLAVPVIWAFLARRRAPRRQVGSLILLRAAAARASAQQVMPRLRAPIALLLTLLALASLVLALAGPSCHTGPSGRVVVVVESSARMARGAADHAFQRARERAERRIQALPPSTEVAVIQAGEHAQLRYGLSVDHLGAIEALRGLVPSGRGGGRSEALSLADALCRDPALDALVWVADRDLPEPPEGCRPYVEVIRAEGSNTGIAELTARRGDGLGLLEIQIGIASDASRLVDLAIRVDGRLVDTARVETRPGAVAWTLRQLHVDGERIEVVLVDTADANPADDRAEVRLAPRDLVQVALITDRPQGFLATALGLHPGLSLQVVPPERAARLADIELGVIEVGAELPEAQRWLAFGSEASRAVGISPGATLKQPDLQRWAFEDPRFAFVDLDEVQIASASVLQVPPGGEALIETEAGALMVAGEVDGRSVTAFGFRPSQTDLALRVDFLHLLANLIDHGAPPDRALATSTAVGASEVYSPLADEVRATPVVARSALGSALVELLLGLALLLLLAETLLSGLVSRLRRRA